MNTNVARNAIERLGYAVVEDVLDHSDIEQLIDSLSDSPDQNQVRRKRATYTAIARWRLINDRVLSCRSEG